MFSWLLRRAGVDLDAPLFRLTPFDWISARVLLTHLLVLGTTGSGKTSSTIKTYLMAIFRAGFGALICTAKLEDADMARDIAKRTSRQNSLLVWAPGNGAFNPIAYELARTGNINNVIDVVMAMIVIVQSSNPLGGRSGERFWTDSMQMVLRFCIPIIYAATGTVRICDILAFIRSAPSSASQLSDPKWQQTSFFCRMFMLAAERMKKGLVVGVDDDLAQRCADFWKGSWAALDAKTAGNIRITIEASLSRYENGILRETLCAGTTISPALLFSDTIIVMDFPVQLHGDDGAILQKVFKYMTQREALARNALPEHLRNRPIAIVVDEAQNLLFREAEFLAQSRSSLVACLYATQSIPSIINRIGGDHPREAAHDFVSQFANVVMHSSGCPETCTWFANKLGRTRQSRASYSKNDGSSTSFGMNMGTGENWGTNSSAGGNTSWSSGPNGQTSRGGGSSWSQGSSSGSSDNWGRNQGSTVNSGQSWSEQEVLENMIEAGEFGRMLKTGGPANDNRVGAIWASSGRIFKASGTNAVYVEYRQ